MELIIRNESRQDLDEIYELIKTAFQTAKIADGDEQDYAVDLRKSDKYINDLALVAEYKGKLIGQVMLTKNYIDLGAEKIEALLLGPVSVALKHRRKGVGARLIAESLKRAAEKGYKAVFLCGDPDYYNRFGFRSVSTYGITYPMNIPPENVLVCQLETDWLKDKKGTISII